MTLQLFLTYHSNHMFCAEVCKTDRRQELAELVFVLVADSFDFQAFLVAKGMEILHRQEADIRRVIPFVR